MAIRCLGRKLLGKCPYGKLCEKQEQIELLRQRKRYIKYKKENLISYIKAQETEQLKKYAIKYYDGFSWEEDISCGKKERKLDSQVKVTAYKKIKCPYEGKLCEGYDVLQESCIHSLTRQLNNEIHQYNILCELINECFFYYRGKRKEGCPIYLSWAIDSSYELYSFLYGNFNVYEEGFYEIIHFVKKRNYEAIQVEVIQLQLIPNSNILDPIEPFIKKPYTALKVEWNQSYLVNIIGLLEEVEKLKNFLSTRKVIKGLIIKVVYVEMKQLSFSEEKMILDLVRKGELRVRGNISEQGIYKACSYVLKCI